MRLLCLFALAVPSPAFADETKADGSASPTVQVHLEAAPDVALVRSLSLDGRVRVEPSHVCAAPCDVAVEQRSDALFFVEGPGVPRSGSFNLGDSVPVNVVVDAGSLTQRYAGITVLTVGAIGAVVGGVVLGLDLFDDASSPTRAAAGGITLGTGLASLAVGITLVATSGTHVEVQRAAALDPLRFEF